MKFCTDCQYFSGGHLANLCKSPQNGVSVIDGSVKTRFAGASRALQYDGDGCGPDAIFWVQKSQVEKSPWYKFWK